MLQYNVAKILVSGCAWSNEAFELWYLLHFQYYENAMARKDFKGLLESHLKPLLGNDFRYEKNNDQMRWAHQLVATLAM